MSKSDVDTAAYAAALDAIKRIPPELVTIFTREDVVDCLRAQYLSYLNRSPFMFSEEEGHVWQVLEALEAVLDNNYDSFSEGKTGPKLNKGIFLEFVSLAYDLRKDQRLVEQMWIVVFLHDIAKYSVQNADHAHISRNIVRDLFKTNDLRLAAPEQERVAWVIENHDVVGNIVSSAERAPRCLTEGLEGLSDEEKLTRLKMLIVLSLCDLRGTRNGEFVNDDNARSRFRATDFGWLKSKEEDLFGWRKERLVRASSREETERKRKEWDATFDRLPQETQGIMENQFNNIKVFTNLLYLALHLDGEELARLFALISLMAEMVTRGKPHPSFQVDFTKGAARGKPGPIVDRFKALLERIELGDLTIDSITEKYDGQSIYGMPISVCAGNLTIDSERIGDEEQAS